MFSHLAAFTALALPLLAVATPTPGASGAGDCDTGAIQCCTTTETAGSVAGASLLALLEIVVQDLTVVLGVGCSPVTIIGVGGSPSCAASPVCCTDNSHGNLVSIGCVPVTL